MLVRSCWSKVRGEFWPWLIKMTAVIITRPQLSIKAAADTYKKAGFDVYASPCFTIETNHSIQPQWLHIEADVWVILSVHALNHALLLAADLKPSDNTRVVAVGPAVVNAWKQHFEHPIDYHPLMNSEGVIETLKQLKPQSVKILTTLGGRDLIKTHCMAERISYSQINTYIRKEMPIDQVGLHALYDDCKKSSVLTATSSGILLYFMSQLSNSLQAQVSSHPVVVGAQRIADLANEMGFKNIHLAANPSDQAMCDAVKVCCEANASNP